MHICILQISKALIFAELKVLAIREKARKLRQKDIL